MAQVTERKQYLESLKKKVKVIYGANRKGPAAARNLGAKYATGRYAAFLDSDDLWLPWTLETYKSLVDMYDPCVISAAVSETESAIAVARQTQLRADFFTDYLETARDPGFVGSGALVVDRKEFIRATGFDERLTVAEDHDFFLRAGVLPRFVRIVSPATVVYRRHNEGLSRRNSEACDGAMRILNKEAQGHYPGGSARQLQRLTLMSRLVRPIALAALRDGLNDKAWRLYRRSFLTNLRLGRVKFLVGFLLVRLFATRKAKSAS